MAFFKKNKSGNTTSEKAVSPLDDNREYVYRDGVFEVFTDKTDGKKYGRIIKYHDGDKIIPVSDEEFSLWSDASENSGKYRITYERDEDFYIEKAHIELADTPKKEQEPKPQTPVLSPEESEKIKKLTDFYEKIRKTTDNGKKMLEKASLEEAFSVCYLCDRAIISIATEAKKNAAPGTELKITLPADLAKLSSNAKNTLFNRVRGLDRVFVICSEHTKRQHSAGGNAQMALTRESAEETVSGFSAHGQKVFIREVENGAIPSEIRDIMCNGLSGIRFIYGKSMSTVLQIAASENANIPYPENIALRRSMTAFFQDYSNGVPGEKLKGAELSMYDAMFGATLLQPYAKKASDGGTSLRLSVVRNKEGDTLLNLFTSPEIMDRSATATQFRHENPEGTGYRKWTFDAILDEIDSDRPCSGFIIDGEFISVPFVGATLERVRKFKDVWEQNGKSFIAKKNQPENK